MKTLTITHTCGHVVNYKTKANPDAVKAIGEKEPCQWCPGGRGPANYTRDRSTQQIFSKASVRKAKALEEAILSDN